MFIRFFDKDGKEHRINVPKRRPVFICAEIGTNTGVYSEIRIEEALRFNKDNSSVETSGCFHIAPASKDACPLGFVPSDLSGEIAIGPVKQLQ
jgi:hypothetical protein